MDSKVSMAFIDLFMVLFIQAILTLVPPQLGVKHDWSDLPRGAELIRLVDSNFERYSLGGWHSIDASKLRERLVLECSDFDCLQAFDAHSQKHDQLALVFPEENSAKAKQIVSQECGQSSNEECSLTIFHDDARVYIKGYKGDIR